MDGRADGEPGDRDPGSVRVAQPGSPRCGAPVARLGRPELTADRPANSPFCAYGTCKEAVSLALHPGSGIDGDAPIPREDAARDAGCGRPIMSHHPPITPEDRHAALVEECLDEADVTFGGSGGKRFGASPLKVRAKIFSTLIADKLVVKLPGSAWRRMSPPASGSALIPVTGDS